MISNRPIQIMKIFRTYLHVLFLCTLTACTAAAPSENPGGASSNITHCQLPTDQGRGSLLGSWQGLGIPIVFDKDFYVTDSGVAMDSVRGAVETWNRWAQAKGHLKAFTIYNDVAGTQGGMEIPNLTDCSQSSYSSAITSFVGVWKLGSYEPRRNSRTSCGAAKKLLPDGVQGQTDWVVSGGKIVGSSILLNFEGFNAPGKDHIDLESLLLHEMGHVLGLYHSCNGSTPGSTDATTAPDCSAGSTNVNYKTAVMFPFLYANQVRRGLQKNDYARINCLY